MSTAPVTLVGNCTNDPELRFTETGSGKVSFGIAVDRNWKSGDEWKTETSFFNIIGWDPIASEAARVVQKGVRVMVSGRLSQRSYEKDGEKKYVIEVVADEVAVSVRAIENFERKVRSEGSGNAARPAAAAPKAQPKLAPSDEPF
jgi:single-strand DNA-binding protein